MALFSFPLFRRFTGSFLLGMLMLPCMAQNVSGIVTDQKGRTLAFSSVYIKGGTRGTTANNEGRYFISLSPGTYTIVCAHVGYQKNEKQIVVSNATQELNFSLNEQLTELKDVIVKANAEDPAYAVI